MRKTETLPPAMVVVYFLRSRFRVCKFLVSGLHHCQLVRQDGEGLHSLVWEGGTLRIIGPHLTTQAVSYLIRILFWLFCLEFFKNVSDNRIIGLYLQR